MPQRGFRTRLLRKRAFRRQNLAGRPPPHATQRNADPGKRLGVTHLERSLYGIDLVIGKEGVALDLLGVLRNLVLNLLRDLVGVAP